MLKVQFGCGGNKLHGWKNHDSEVDIRKPIHEYKPNSVDFILAEHVIEHITSGEMINFFYQCERLLKPGGWMRLVFPDTMKLLKTETSRKQAYWDFCAGYTKVSADRSAVAHSMGACHGHQQFLEADLLADILVSMGWDKVVIAPLYNFMNCDNEPVDGHWKAIGKEYYEAESSAIECMKEM